MAKDITIYTRTTCAYCERSSVEGLIHRMAPPVLSTLIFVGAIVLLVAFFREPAWRLVALQPLMTTIISVVILLALTWWTARCWCQWQYLVLEVDRGLVELHRPEIGWLLLTSEPISTPAFKLSIRFAKKSFLQMIIFWNSRTVTIDSENQEDTALHDMKYIHDWKRLKRVVDNINRASNIY